MKQEPILLTYKLIKLLGSGTFGKANLVQCRQDKKMYVMKTIPMQELNKEERKKALLEAKILNCLDHPNVIKFIEAFNARKPNYTLNIVTDYAEGGDLSNIIVNQKKIPFSEIQILDWITQLVIALNYIHKKKILHRDIKPANCFLSKNGMIKLGDFGVSAQLQSTMQMVTTLKGSGPFIAPELFNDKEYSYKADIWSLGVLIYNLMTFKLPFTGNTIFQISNVVCKGNYEPLPNTYSSELIQLVNSMLNLDPDKRPLSKDILDNSLLRTRIYALLEEVEYDPDFSNKYMKNSTNSLEKTTDSQSHETIKESQTNSVNQNNHITTNNTQNIIINIQSTTFNDFLKTINKEKHQIPSFSVSKQTSGKQLTMNKKPMINPKIILKTNTLPNPTIINQSKDLNDQIEHKQIDNHSDEQKQKEVTDANRFLQTLSDISSNKPMQEDNNDIQFTIHENNNEERDNGLIEIAETPTISIKNQKRLENETRRIKLESELGHDVFNLICKVIEQNTNEYDLNIPIINRLVSTKMNDNKYSQQIIDMALSKVTVFADLINVNKELM